MEVLKNIDRVATLSDLINFVGVAQCRGEKMLTFKIQEKILENFKQIYSRMSYN